MVVSTVTHIKQKLVLFFFPCAMEVTKEEEREIVVTESVWREAQDYQPYSDYDLPFLFGDFHSTRKEEQNKFLLDVSYHGNNQSKF